MLVLAVGLGEENRYEKGSTSGWSFIHGLPDQPPIQLKSDFSRAPLINQSLVARGAEIPGRFRDRHRVWKQPYQC